MSDKKDPKEETTEQEEEQNPNIPQYKVTEKKTLDEYNNLDAEDESLRKWKESLGISAGSKGPADDSRRVVILEMTMFVEGLDPVTLDMQDPKVLEDLKTKPLQIKEKSKYHLQIKFKIQHEIVTGLKYTQISKRGGIRLNKTEEVCGSFAPNTEETPFYVKDLEEGEAPGGFLARGYYTATSTFSDDDGVVHVEVPWCFDLVKK